MTAPAPPVRTVVNVQIYSADTTVTVKTTIMESIVKYVSELSLVLYISAIY